MQEMDYLSNELSETIPIFSSSGFGNVYRMIFKVRLFALKLLSCALTYPSSSSNRFFIVPSYPLQKTWYFDRIYRMLTLWYILDQFNRWNIGQNVSIPYKRVTTFTPYPISPLLAKPNKLYLALISP